MAMLKSAEIIARGAGAVTFPCGHPRTLENSASVGIENGIRCRVCRRMISKRSNTKRRQARKS